MKILILVLSYTEWPFDAFMKMQQATWDAAKHPNIDVRYYYGYTYMGSNESIDNSRHGEMCLSCSDDYEMMHWKFKLALDAIDYHKYDLIFRTNSCSYIIKDKLLKIAETLPKTGCYAGYHNGGYISGAGIFFSPDVLDILRNELTDVPHGAEDVLMGHILAGKVEMTAENSRVDAKINGVTDYNTSYHFRFKTSNDLKDRQRDIDNMLKLHQRL